MHNKRGVSFFGRSPAPRVNSAPASSAAGSAAGSHRSPSAASLARSLHGSFRRRAQSVHAIFGRLLHDGKEGDAHPLMVSRFVVGPGADVCPFLLEDPRLRALSRRALSKQGKALSVAALPRVPTARLVGEEARLEAAAEEEVEEAVLPPVARARGWYRAFLMGCACALQMGYVAGKMGVMAASVGLMAELGISAQMYGVVAGTPALATVLFAPFGGRAVDALGADSAAPIFAFLVLLGCCITTLSAGLRSIALLLVGQALVGLGKPLGISQLVFLRVAAGPSGAGPWVAVANATYHLTAFLAFLAFPPLAHAVALRLALGRGGDAGERTKVLVPLAASAFFAAASLACALALRGQLGSGVGGKGGQEGEEEEDGQEDGPGVDSKEEEKEEAAALEGGSREGVSSWLRRRLCCSSDTQGGGGSGGESYGLSYDACGLRLLWAVMGTFYGSTMVFEAFAVPYLVHDRGLAPERAAAAAGIFEVGSIVLGPLVGLLADRDLAPQEQEQEQEAEAPPLPWRSSQRGRRPLWSWRWWRWQFPPGCLQLAASACGALGLLLPLLAPHSWPLGFSLVSVGVATAGVAYWLSIPLFASPEGLGRAVGTGLAVNEGATLLLNVAVGLLLDKSGGSYRGGVLPFLLSFAVVGTGLSVVLLPRIKRALVIVEEEEEEENEKDEGASFEPGAYEMK